ncbi:MAG TPA: anti-sigma factor [Sphingomicrobium sp.]|jgi:anti-sigma factor RsiW
MPACADQELLLGGLVDGELDAANVAMVEAHVARCEGCRGELERLQAVRNLLRAEGVRQAAPKELSKRIATLPELAPKAVNENRISRWLGPALGGALAASLAMVALLPPASSSIVDEELVSSHVRSLQPGHLTDVQTTNQHIVKPWFNGRIDFSPPVPELADAGFPLAGGRLDSIDGKTVAAIVYHRRLHTVNLFIWPARDGAERSFDKDGFSVKEWSRNGLRFAAISDIPAAELQQFHKLFEQRS